VALFSHLSSFDPTNDQPETLDPTTRTTATVTMRTPVTTMTQTPGMMTTRTPARTRDSDRANASDDDSTIPREDDQPRNQANDHDKGNMVPAQRIPTRTTRPARRRHSEPQRKRSNSHTDHRRYETPRRGEPKGQEIKMPMKTMAAIRRV